MKYLKIILLLIVAGLSSCDLGTSRVQYSNVLIPISEKTVPETGTVGESLTIYAKATTSTSCWYGINFTLVNKDGHNYDLYALASYDNYDGCTNDEVTVDSLIALTPSEAGDYIIYTWYDYYSYGRDTIVVSEPVTEK